MISATTTTTIRWVTTKKINKAAAATLINSVLRLGGAAEGAAPSGPGIYQRHRYCFFSTSAATTTAATTNDLHYHLNDSSKQELREPNPEMVDARQAPSDYVSSSAVVYKDFVTEEEAQILVKDIRTCMKRRRYEKGHWDAVIVNYKETELIDEGSLLSETSRRVLDRVRHQLKERHLSPSRRRLGGDGDDITWLPCHAIDLHKTGELNAHVDSVRFSGDIVAGLSFLSSSIMRLRPDDDGEEVTGLCCSSSNSSDSGDEQDHLKDNNKTNATTTTTKMNHAVNWVDLFLPPRSLYVLADAARYHYSHQLLPSGSFFVGQGPVERDHRISVIFRDAKTED